MQYATESTNKYLQNNGQISYMLIKRAMRSEVPDFLKEFVENGMSPEEAFAIANARNDSEDESKIVPKMKVVHETMKKID